jgi:hypothetical protein
MNPSPPHPDSLTHVVAELRRLGLEGVLSADGAQHVVRRDAYAGSFEVGLAEFGELAASVADGAGLRGLYLARDGFRDDCMVTRINMHLERCAIRGYTARHRTCGGGNTVAVTDGRGHELPRPPFDAHGHELLRLLSSLADGCGLSGYTVALAAAGEAELLYV